MVYVHLWYHVTCGVHLYMYVHVWCHVTCGVYPCVVSCDMWRMSMCGVLVCLCMCVFCVCICVCSVCVQGACPCCYGNAFTVPSLPPPPPSPSVLPSTQIGLAACNGPPVIKMTPYDVPTATPSNTALPLEQLPQSLAPPILAGTTASVAIEGAVTSCSVIVPPISGGMSTISCCYTGVYMRFPGYEM